MRKKRTFVILLSIGVVVFCSFFMIGNHVKIREYSRNMKNNYFSNSTYLQEYFEDTFIELAYYANATNSQDVSAGNLFLTSTIESENVQKAQNLFSDSVKEASENTKSDPNVHFTVNTNETTINTGNDNLSTIANDPTLTAKYRWYGIVKFDAKGNVTPDFHYSKDEQPNNNLTMQYTQIVDRYEAKFKDRLEKSLSGNVDPDTLAELKADIELTPPVSTSVIIAIPMTTTSSGPLYSAIASATDYSNNDVIIPYLFFVGIITLSAALISTILLYKDLRYRNLMKKVKIEVVLLIAVSIVMLYTTFSFDFVREVTPEGVASSASTLALGPFSFLTSQVALNIIAFFYWGVISATSLYVFNYLFAFVATGIVGSFNEQSLLVDFVRGLFNLAQKIARDYNLYSKIIALVIFAVADVILAIIGRYSMPVFLIFLAINSIVVLAVVMYIFHLNSEYERILELSDQLANSDFNTLIESDVKVLIPLANRLQEIQKNFERSVKEETLVQRQKADLITNVSHDLKTPLTTILTYTELLQHKDMTEEDREKFRVILQKNALRLKTLIDDLFVVTELNNGITKVELTQIDIVSLLQQVQLDVQHLLDANELDLRLTISERPIMLNLDGERTSRVFENILGNIAKYAQKGSRVYIDIDKYGDVVKIEFKNIANYEMLFDADTIYERFVQGDASRNTEGTGLGLAIVKSLVELQGGKFEVTVDGDLFKAIIIFKTTN